MVELPFLLLLKLGAAPVAAEVSIRIFTVAAFMISL